MAVLAMVSPVAAIAADPPTLLLRASNVSKAAIEDIVPGCATAARVAVKTEYANNPAIAKDISGGAAVDVVVIETHMLDNLAKQGFVARRSIRQLAGLRMALATREPGPDPRMNTVADFKRALRGARSIGYVGDGHSGELFLQIVDRLKMRRQLGDRLVPFTGAYAGAAEASARLQYVVAPFFNPLPAPLRLVGRFPAALNSDVVVAVGASSTAGPNADTFIACLRSPASLAVFSAKGYQFAN